MQGRESRATTAEDETGGPKPRFIVGIKLRIIYTRGDSGEGYGIQG